MHCIELLGLPTGQMGHAGRDDFQTGCFETGIDLANDILGNGVRLDDGKSAFNSHFIFLEWG